MTNPARDDEYNPLDYANLTRSCVEELMQRGPYRLPLANEFRGAGVYALFYTGDFDLYADLRSPDAMRPIYVGKAVPAGARTGRRAAGRARREMSLFNRLKEHTESIQLAESTLCVEAFMCRYLVVTPLWITMAERFLIEHYQPLWNIALDGFGNHDPGGNRAGGLISWWDLLHPGRSDTWTGRPTATVTKTRKRRATKTRPAYEELETITRTVDEAREKVRQYLRASSDERERMAREAVARAEEQEGQALNGAVETDGTAEEG